MVMFYSVYILFFIQSSLLRCCWGWSCCSGRGECGVDLAQDGRDSCSGSGDTCSNSGCELPRPAPGNDDNDLQNNI